jgi:hypothetical protein
MDIRLIMSILHPILAAAFLLVAGLSLLFWAMRRRTNVALSQALCFFAEFTTMVLLVLTTGTDPVLDIEDLRAWIVATRFMLLAALLFHAWHLWRRLRAQK